MIMHTHQNSRNFRLPRHSKWGLSHSASEDSCHGCALSEIKVSMNFYNAIIQKNSFCSSLAMWLLMKALHLAVTEEPQICIAIAFCNSAQTCYEQCHSSATLTFCHCFENREIQVYLHLADKSVSLWHHHLNNSHDKATCTCVLSHLLKTNVLNANQIA